MTIILRVVNIVLLDKKYTKCVTYLLYVNNLKYLVIDIQMYIIYFDATKYLYNLHFKNVYYIRHILFLCK